MKGRYIIDSIGSSHYKPIRRSRHITSQMKRLAKGRSFWFGIGGKPKKVRV